MIDCILIYYCLLCPALGIQSEDLRTTAASRQTSTHLRRRNSEHPHTPGQGEATHRLHRSQQPTILLIGAVVKSEYGGSSVIRCTDPTPQLCSYMGNVSFRPTPIRYYHSQTRAHRRGSVPTPTRYQRHLVFVIRGTSSNTLWRIPRPCVFHLISALPVHGHGWSRSISSPTLVYASTPSPTHQACTPTQLGQLGGRSCKSGIEGKSWSCSTSLPLASALLLTGDIYPVL
jgi:hypothetical protein